MILTTESRVGSGSDAHVEDERKCASCESKRGVRPHPRMRDVFLCADCLDIAVDPLERRRLGLGTRG